MKKLITALIILAITMFSCAAFAAGEQKNTAADKTTAPKKEATQNTESIDEKPQQLTLDEMNKQLAEGEQDVLYIKTADDEVWAYKNIAASRSLRKQLILAAPGSNMLRLYTNHEATYQQMSKMLKDYENSGYSFDGYRIITDTDNTKKLDNGITIYRFWFMKLAKEKHDRRFPVGIGIGIGGGHHHGPWIGVGL